MEVCPPQTVFAGENIDDAVFCNPVPNVTD